MCGFWKRECGFMTCCVSNNFNNTDTKIILRLNKKNVVN